MITHVMEKIGPERAEQILETNTKNRKLSSSRVTHFANQMKDGAWNFDGTPVRIDDKGDLVDGQHRLWAIVESGTTQDFLVVRGVDEASMATMDTGKSRSFADILSLHDRNATQIVALSAAIAILYRWEQGKRGSALAPASNPSSQVPYPKLIAFYDANREKIQRVTNQGRRISSKKGLGGPTGALAVWVLSEINLEDALYFFDRIRDGIGLGPNHPILTLRNWLSKQKSTPGPSAPVEVQVAYLFKAWNAFRRGDEMKNLSWRRGGHSPEAFPVPE